MTTLETQRLFLRAFNVDDAQFVLTLLNEPSFIRYIGDKQVRNVDDARRYLLNGPIASYERHGFGLCAVELRESRTPIGMCGLLKREELPDPDIGFAFLPDFWSKGFAFEAAAAVLQLLGLQMESEWDMRRQVTMMLAKMAVGAGPLRSKCACEIKTS